MNIYKPYVAGKFSETDKYFSVNETYTGAEFAKAGKSDPSMVEEAIYEANKAESKMAELGSHEKYEILSFISQQLYHKREHFARIIACEAGKPLKFARVEAERASQVFQTAAEESKRINTELLTLDWFAYGHRKEAMIKLFPVGTVAGITPFNFPLNLVAHKVAPAIAAGCPIIIKPASVTPVSALELALIIHESGLPKGAFSVLPASHDIAAPLIEDERIKKISFTGSPEIGWNLKSRCGKKKITLELGGNAAAIVTPTANTGEAVAKCVTGAFAFSGQVCIHTQRIFVQEGIFQSFLKDFVMRARQWKEGNPLENGTDISILIDQDNAIRVQQWIKEASDDGAVIVLGGCRNNSFVEPTVLTNTKPTMKVRKSEIFGPVVTIEKYSDFEEAVNLVNDSEYGLQAGVFTNSIDEMNTAFRKIKTAGILINESPTFRIDHMPYGGIKDSGFGREGVKYAIQEMCEMKLLLKPF